MRSSVVLLACFLSAAFVLFLQNIRLNHYLFEITKNNDKENEVYELPITQHPAAKHVLNNNLHPRLKDFIDQERSQDHVADAISNNDLRPLASKTTLRPKLSDMLQVVNQQGNQRQKQQGKQRQKNQGKQRKEHKIVGNVSWLLDFAVIGFPKCGTTTMRTYLDSADGVRMLKGERWNFGNNPAVEVFKLYNISDDNKRGLDCPGHVYFNKFKQTYQRHFNKTNFIVGIRHPVRWFESFYNYRIQCVNNLQNRTLPHPNELIDEVWLQLSVKKSRYHYYLSTFGKTPVSSAQEKEYIQPDEKHQIIPTESKLFLYDVSQLNDKNETRAIRFREDLSHFLGLENLLPPMIQVKPETLQQNISAEEQAMRDSYKIDICKKEYEKVRSALMGNAVNASRWIREHLLESEDVVVSSRDFFKEIMRKWEHDLCEVDSITKEDSV